ncbi:aldehyde dehydrogenase [Dactylonectria estremocensis]|uniref:Aldehyde dehydrogenase n=1 Tax=Dactylonectria estremocensis TaxID=1079267 RepID=A0A9P9JDZ9_9HYPO|nr:aldehyde dehydrogenase [Dactylonectria estremocensis]
MADARILFNSENVIVDTSSKTHHHLALWPPASSDPKDPLRLPRWFKIVALLSVASFNFVANFAGAGLSVAEVILEMQFQKSAKEINSLMTFNFLLLGIGNMVWVPFSVKYGKRPVLLVSMGMLFGVLIWTAKAKTYNELLAARCLSGFVSAAGESIVPGVVSDMFYLHERGVMMSIYVILISCGSAAGPLIAGFMVESTPGTWRDFTWLCAAIAGFDFVAIFLFFPETSFVRPPLPDSPALSSNQDNTSVAKEEIDGASNVAGQTEHLESDNGPVSVSWGKIWTSFIHYNPVVSLPRAFVIPFLFLGCIPVLWATLVYGAALASQVILIFAFPSLLLAPPYLFANSSVGLMQVAAIIGFVIACYGGGYICDVITARLIVRNGGVFVPEQRLISLAPGCLVAPIGCIIVAIACDRSLSWVAIAVGFGMVSFGTVYAPNVAMTYLLDSYPAFAQEILVAINVTKNLVAFLFLYVAVDWINSQGWIQVYMIMFAVVTLSMLLALPIYLFGRRARGAYSSILAVVSFISPDARHFPTLLRHVGSKPEDETVADAINTTTQNQLEKAAKNTGIPLLIDGIPVIKDSAEKVHTLSPTSFFHGADVSDCIKAAKSSSKAFVQWSQSSPLERRRLLLKLSQLLLQRQDEAINIMRSEIHCSEQWAAINVADSAALIEEAASLITSNATSGAIPHTSDKGSYGLVFNRPLGVILGIAPWNGPLILGFRAVVAPIATGNTAILKGSELSPGTHHFIAQLFVEAGFPPGVVNFILHRPEDAAEVVETLIKHPAIRKINFTGSTGVGRIIAQMAGKALKPGGQICMSTDLVIVSRDIVEDFRVELRQALRKHFGTSYKVISSRSATKSHGLFADAAAKGSNVLSSESHEDHLNTQIVPISVIEDVQPSMEFFSVESFGPMLGIATVSNEDEAIEMVNASEYGLSAAIWTRDHYRALELAQRLDVGAVHVNASTVHDEATLPHGGVKASGFGRFGAEWGLREFLQTQTVVLNP